jgi:hypothetical protein
LSAGCFPAAESFLTSSGILPPSFARDNRNGSQHRKLKLPVPQDLLAFESLKRSSAKAYYEFEAEAALGLLIQLVTGYKGTADSRLAAEGGEFAGGC